MLVAEDVNIFPNINIFIFINILLSIVPNIGTEKPHSGITIKAVSIEDIPRKKK